MPQLASFTVENLVFGLDVRAVQEVLQHQTITPVPLAPPEVLGLVNLRGQVLAAIDLRVLLGWGPLAMPHELAGEDVRTDCVVVLQTATEPVALLVDSFGDVVDVQAETFEACDSLLSDSVADMIIGAYRMPAGLLHLLDPVAMAARIFKRRFARSA